MLHKLVMQNRDIVRDILKSCIFLCRSDFIVIVCCINNNSIHLLLSSDIFLQPNQVNLETNYSENIPLHTYYFCRPLVLFCLGFASDEYKKGVNPNRSPVYAYICLQVIWQRTLIETNLITQPLKCNTNTIKERCGNSRRQIG